MKINFSSIKVYINQEIQKLYSVFAPILHSHGNITSNGMIGDNNNNSNKNVVTNQNGQITIEDKPTIPTKTSQLTNDSNYIKKSSTIGYIKNDGTIGTPTNTTYTAGTGLNLSNNSFSVNYGTTNTTACVGNDSRLSNTRTPTFNTIVANSDSIIDLNTYRTGGFYYCGSNAYSQYVIHCPKSNGTATPYTGNKAFFLLVETFGQSSNYYVKQTLTYYDTNQTFIRTKEESPDAGTSWKSWVEVSKDTTYSTATQSANGLLSSTDKKKLDGITESADAVSFTQTKTSGIEIGKININGTETTLYQQDNNTTYSTATQSANGLMSSTDKTKLDGIATGATKVTVDTSLSSTSTNPVQNKVINTALGTYLPNNKNGTTTGHLTQANGYVSTSGGTGNIPISQLLSTTDSITTYLPKMKTFIGGINFDGSYKNVISVRYRNGSGDGNLYGLYLSAPMTADGNLVWNKQRSVSGTGTWQGERTILDTGNTSFTQTKTSGIEIGKITINGATKTLYQQDNNTTYSNATTSAAGLMSKDDKTKLDGIATEANKYTHPSYTARTGVPTANTTLTHGGTFTVSQPVTDATGHVTALNTRTYTLPTDNNTTYTAGTGLTLSNGAFSVNYGTTATTACAGNDSRLSNARTPTSHTHGNITNAGAIGSTANLPIITDTNGVLKTGSFGTAANTFCQGNDSRLSNARTPTSHTHGNITDNGKVTSTTSNVTRILVTDGDTVNSTTKIPADNIRTGWTNVTVDSQGNLVSNFTINGITYKQLINKFGISIINLFGTPTTSSDTNKSISIGIVNKDYRPIDVQYSYDNVITTKNIDCYGIFHKKGTVMGKIEYNSINDNSKWRVMLINNSSTEKPSINGNIIFCYE